MINVDTIKRDARANIKDWPVTIRYGGVTMQADLNAGGGAGILLDGGTLEDSTLTFTAIADDFTKLPEPFKLLELKLANGKWKKLNIVNVPDLLDPLSPTITIITNTEEK